MKAAPVALVLLAALAAEVSAQAAPLSRRPAGVTDSAIARGRELFHESARCSGCHGVAGRGSDWGPNITGALWLHGPGTYESLIEQVKHGVPASRSYTGEGMPPRGVVPLTEDAVRAVAAYVWSISHPPQPPSRRAAQPGG